MEEYLSASANRAVESAAEWAVKLATTQVDPSHLLLGIAEQEESRGASLLARCGLRPGALRACIGSGTANQVQSRGHVPVVSEEVRRILSRARGRSIERGPDNPAGTDTLLFELLNLDEIRHLLSSIGVDIAALQQQVGVEVESEPLATGFSSLELGVVRGGAVLAPPLTVGQGEREDDEARKIDTYRILDASANRACEGLRVLEDFARFACDDPFHGAELKQIRHELRAQLNRLPRYQLLASRDAAHDVGTTYSTEGEWSRRNSWDLVAANFKRLQEALRSLEEFGKFEDRVMAEAMEALRYRVYSLERSMLIGLESRTRIQGVTLYLLVSSEQCRGGLEWTVHEAIAGGVQMIQLREKSRADGEVLSLAHALRHQTREAGVLFIVNDRPDIARLADADGVHVGQTELSVRDARRIVGPDALVGVSTHSIEQARQAVLDGANYIGVGPTFPSATKAFDTFPGLDLMRRVQAEIRLPAFAIGGIQLDRLHSVLEAGAQRIAVGAAICAAADPRAAATALRGRMEEWESDGRSEI